jgi:hypothetical protein
MIRGLGDPSITTGDNRVAATGVMSHDDGVVDRPLDTGGLDVISGTPLGGWVKREAKTMRSAVGGARGTQGTGGGTSAPRGVGGGTSAMRVVNGGAGAARGMDEGMAQRIISAPRADDE